MKRGDRFLWNGDVAVIVTRVARDGTWADMSCRFVLGGKPWGKPWTKRHALPLPPAYRPVTP